MKRFYFSLVSLCVLALWVGWSFQTNAQSEPEETDETNFVSPNFVISQFQVAGGSANDELSSCTILAQTPLI